MKKYNGKPQKDYLPLVTLYTQQKESKRKNRNKFHSTLPLTKVQDSRQPDCNIYFSNCKWTAHGKEYKNYVGSALHLGRFSNPDADPLLGRPSNATRSNPRLGLNTYINLIQMQDAKFDLNNPYKKQFASKFNIQVCPKTY
jgi:hypothetical protein